jgi:porin
MVRVPVYTLLGSVALATATAQTPTSAPAPAEERPSATRPAETPEAESRSDLFQNDRLTGDWTGWRPKLEDAGVFLDLSMTNVFQQNVKGGVRTRNAHRVSGSYDLELKLDFEALKLWKGGTLYAWAEGSWDSGISGHGYVGDLFGVNFDAIGNQEIYLGELWYEQSFLDDKLRVRLGKLYLPTDFDTNVLANDSSTQFLNSALVNAPSIPEIFQNYGQGIQFIAKPCEWFYFGAGVTDADANRLETGFSTAFHGPADFFSMYEFGLTPAFETAWGKLPGNYRFGLWYDPQPKAQFFDDLGGRRRRIPMRTDDAGFYTSCDQVVIRESPSVEGDEQGFGLFCRYAYAPGDLNVIEDFWSVGGQYQGLIPTRDKDVLAFGVGQGILSRNLRLTGADPHRETALELYYNIQVLPWLALTPDFQWILRPGGENGRDAFVAGVRLQMSF